MSKIQKYISNPQLICLKLDELNLIRLSDEKFLKLKYKRKFNKELCLNNPQTFNEKLQWLKLYDRKDIYTTMVDKYEVKTYVSDMIGEEYIIPTLGIYNKFEDVNFDKLPNQFVLKCTHDSGGLVICKDKKNFNKKDARKKINKCLKRNFYYEFREWPYKNVKPKILVEKYIKNDNEEDLIDYKFMCFNGKAKYIFVCSNRHTKTGLNIDVFDINWTKMPFGRLQHPNSSNNIEKPKKLSQMIELSEKLAKNNSFIRVDFYEVSKKIYFSELTFYPSAGFESFDPEEYDKILGDMIELPKLKEEEKDEK